MGIGLWASVARAGCCTVAGVEPIALYGCETLGAVVSSGAQVETGSWDYDGAWVAPGGDGGLAASLSVGLVGRPARSLVLGVRLPMTLELDRLDGLERADWGLGHFYPWARAERALTSSFVGGWTLGLATRGPTSGYGPGSRSLETGPSAMQSGAGGVLAGQLLVALPLIGHAPYELKADLMAARSVGSLMLGARTDGSWAWSAGTLVSELRAGPSLSWLRPGAGRWQLSALASPPLRGFGSHSASTLELEIAWLASLGS